MSVNAIFRQLRIHRLSVALIVQVIKVKSRNPDMLKLRIFHDPWCGKEITRLQFHFQPVPENDLREVERLDGTNRV